MIDNGSSAIVVLISGPFVSISIAISSLTARTLPIILSNPSLLKCAELSRTTLRPSLNKAWIKSTSQRLSDMVAIIFVCLAILYYLFFDCLSSSYSNVFNFLCLRLFFKAAHCPIIIFGVT